MSSSPQVRGWEKKIADGPPCVVLASAGMLQGGTSRELLELWAPDARNGLIITGYSVEGTLARVSCSPGRFAIRYTRCTLLREYIYFSHNHEPDIFESSLQERGLRFQIVAHFNLYRI